MLVYYIVGPSPGKIALVKGEKIPKKKKKSHSMITKLSWEEFVYKDVFIYTFPLSLPGIEMSWAKKGV